MFLNFIGKLFNQSDIALSYAGTITFLLWYSLYLLHQLVHEMFGDTKGVIRNCKSKMDMQYNREKVTTEPKISSTKYYTENSRLNKTNPTNLSQ